MKKYYLLLMNGLICITQEERTIIQRDEQMLRQAMNKDQISARVQDLIETKNQYDAYWNIIDTFHPNTTKEFLQNLLRNAIRRINAKFFYINIDGQYVMENIDALLAQQIRDHYSNYNNQSLHLIIEQTNGIYGPVIHQLQNELPNVLPENVFTPLLNEAARKYAIITNIIQNIIQTPNRTITSTIQPNDIPVFIQYVW